MLSQLHQIIINNIISFNDTIAQPLTYRGNNVSIRKVTQVQTVLMLCTGYIYIREIIGILAAQQANLVGICHTLFSVTLDTNVLQNAILTTLW